MSYDIRLKDPETGEMVRFEEPVDIRGGTYILDGTYGAWLNVTYNYSSHFYRVMGEKGIRELYGLTSVESIPILEAAIASLNTDADDDYWKPTEGNARAALLNLLILARLCPSAIWDGD